MRRQDAEQQLEEQRQEFQKKAKKSARNVKEKKNLFRDLVPKFFLLQFQKAKELQSTMLNSDHPSLAPKLFANVLQDFVDNAKPPGVAPDTSGDKDQAGDAKQPDTERDQVEGPTQAQKLNSRNSQLSPVAKKDVIIRSAAGFSSHLRSQESRTMIGQMVLKVKNDTNTTEKPSSREGFLMVMLKAGIIPSDILMVGGLGSDVVTSLDSFHLIKRKWKFGEYDIKDIPSSILKIYNHAGDVYDNNVYFFGGCVSYSNAKIQTYSNDLFCLTPATNTTSRINISNSRRPKSRSGHAAAIVANLFVVLGGKSENNEFRADCWMFVLGHKPGPTEKLAWTQIITEGTSGSEQIEFADLCGHSMIAIPKNINCPQFFGLLIVFGGIDSEMKLSNKLTKIKIDKNRKQADCSYIVANGIPPCARQYHACAFMPSYGSIVIYGGRNVLDAFLDDIFMFQLNNLTWIRVYSKAGTPSIAKCMHQMVATKNSLYVFGGYSDKGFCQSLLHHYEIMLDDKPDENLPISHFPSKLKNRFSILASE